jgi:hypothetical protein
LGKGSNTTTTNTTSSADPQAASLYRDILQRAQGVASTPYQAYTGDLTAGVNAQQTAGIGGINSAAGYANPYIQQASSQAAASTAPITGATIQQYQNPYTQQVVDATTNQLRSDFGQQHAQLTGNQIAQGALGGNATGVARGILSGQQGRTMASTTADLYNKSYQQALQAAQQQQATGLQGANAQANYGISGQAAALQGAGAQIGAGTLQQQTQQAQLDAAYKQYMQQQAYPYQQTQWLGGIATGVGSNLGGTSAGSTTGPAPNQTAQWIGAGLSAAALLSDRDAKEGIEKVGELNDGTPIYRYRYKGRPEWHVGPIAQEVEERAPQAVSRGVDGMRYVDMHEATEDSVERAAGGGVQSPWGAAEGWIPTIGISAGRGAPAASAPSGGGEKGSQPDPSKIASGISGAMKGIGGLDWGGLMNSGGNFSGEAWGGGSFLGGDMYGGSSASPASGLDASDYGIGFADGGPVMSDEDPVGVAGGQQFAQSSPIQMRPTGNGQVQVINIRTGQVLYTGTASGAANAQASHAGRLRAAGGGVAGYQGGGAPGFDDRFNAAYGGYEGYDIVPTGVAGPGPDSDESRYAEGNEFSTMMNNPDPFGDTNRVVAHDALRRGDGITMYSDPPVTGPDGKLMGNQTSVQGVPNAPAGAPVVADDDEEAPAPTDTSARSRGVAGPPVTAFAPSGPGSYGSMPDATRRPASDERGGLGLLPISPNASTGLLTAGLGMLASRSPFLGNAIGEGGIAGLSAYGSAEQNDRKVLAEAAKLSEESRRHNEKFGLDKDKHGETVRHNKVTEQNAASGRDKLPPGMRIGKDGNVELMPGVDTAAQKLAAARRPPAGASMDDETADFLASRVLAGDTKALVGLGRGAQGAENLAKINGMVAQKAKAGEPVSAAAREILQNAAQQEGLKTAERTQATIMAKLSVYGRTAFNATDIAERLSAEVPRTNFMPVNKIINAAKTKTGDPKIVALGQALMTLTNEYARAIGGGHGTVHDKEAAEKRLSEAQSHEQLKAVINVMRQEILAEEKAMPAARQHIRDIYNPLPGGSRGKSIAGEHGAEPPPGPVSGASGFQPPAGAIPRTYQGKTYYYDPNTKQPYPGQ